MTEWLETVEDRAPDATENRVALSFHGLGVNWNQPVDNASSAWVRRLFPYAIEKRTPLGRSLVTVGGQVRRFMTRRAARADVKLRRMLRDQEFGSESRKLINWKVVKR